jgi:hypothetical protein
VLQLLRRPPSWLAWALLAVGIAGLLLPWFFAPIMSDERYHYPAAPVRMDNNLLNVLPWAIEDVQRRMATGRIVPVGIFAQQVGYLLGMQFSFSTGIPLFVVHGIVKLLLLVAAVASFALLLSQLRRRDGAPLDGGVHRTATLVFGSLLMLGVTATTPARNGWTTFLVLCIGGITLMFLAGAASLWALRSWSGLGVAGRVLSALGLLLLGVWIMLSYEMHWAAVPFAVVLLAFAGSASWWHRGVLILSLAGGWLAAVLWTRQLIKNAVTVTYVGLDIELTGAIPRTTVLQLVNAIPGSGIGRAMRDVGEGMPKPHAFGGTGWVWGLFAAAGLAILLARRSDASKVSGWLDRHPLLVLAGALAVSALAAAVILSLSVQSHQIVSRFGATYRGTPWIWACLAGALTLGLVSLPSSSGIRRVALVAAPAALALLVGVLVWPTTVSSIQTLRAVDQYALWEAAQGELVTGSPGSRAEERRCQISRQWASTAESSAYFALFLPKFEDSFSYQWHRPWCSSVKAPRD